MCDNCRAIKAAGKTPLELLDHSIQLAGTTKYDEPIFSDALGKYWSLVRDPLYEDLYFIPADRTQIEHEAVHEG